jgi:hypothetical protein
MTPKAMVTQALLLFAALSLGVLIGRELERRGPRAGQTGPPAATASARPAAAPAVVAYYAHGSVRCTTCKTIETYASETIHRDFAQALRDGRLSWREVNFEEPAYEHFLDDYELSSASLVLVAPGTAGPGSFAVLQDVWQLTDDKPAFTAYVRREVDRFLEAHGG